MINGQKVLAIIPARGGSKGLPNKNIKSINGKPLIAWTIEQSLQSKYIDKTIVSSDSLEIINISKKHGADVPFVRPDEFATDFAKSIDVIKHAINYFNNEFSVVILLQPTSPLRTYTDIDNAFSEFNKTGVKSVVSVCELEHPIQWVGMLPENLCLNNFTDNAIKNVNRQQLEKYFRYNGAIYVADIKYILENNGFHGQNTYAYIMKKENSVDIDDEFDFKIAESLMIERKNGEL